MSKQLTPSPRERLRIKNTDQGSAEAKETSVRGGWKQKGTCKSSAEGVHFLGNVIAQKADEEKGRMSNLFGNPRGPLLEGLRVSSLSFKCRLFITPQLPGYPPNAKTTQSINNSC